jgi:hypothetical protein
MGWSEGRSAFSAAWFDSVPFTELGGIQYEALAEQEVMSKARRESRHIQRAGLTVFFVHDIGIRNWLIPGRIAQFNRS